MQHEHKTLLMQEKVAAHQEVERWKAHMTSVVAGCQIVRARTLECDLSDKRNPIFELLVENLTGTWHLRKTLLDIRTFTVDLGRAFPVEAGEKRHGRIIPECPSLGGMAILASPKTKVKLLRRSVDGFCKTLLNLPPYISRSRIVLDFFLTNSESAMLDNRAPSIQAPLAVDRASVQSCSISSASSRSHKNSSQQYVGPMHRVKVKYCQEYKLVDYDPSSKFEVYLRSILTKHGISKETVDLAYRDEDGDLILVNDNEDLDVAISIFGRTLVLHVDVGGDIKCQ
jgi:hypothetical protein